MPCVGLPMRLQVAGARSPLLSRLQVSIRENVTMSSSIMEDKESTSVLRVIIGLVTVLTLGGFAAIYFFVGESTMTDMHQNKSEAKQTVPAPNATPHPVDLL